MCTQNSIWLPTQSVNNIHCTVVYTVLKWNILNSSKVLHDDMYCHYSLACAMPTWWCHFTCYTTDDFE